MKNNFSYDGLGALFDYIEELEHDIGEDIEFDPIALCCEYSEYDSFKELKDEIKGWKEQIRDLSTSLINLSGREPGQAGRDSLKINRTAA